MLNCLFFVQLYYKIITSHIINVLHVFSTITLLNTHVIYVDQIFLEGQITSFTMGTSGLPDTYT